MSNLKSLIRKLRVYSFLLFLLPLIGLLGSLLISNHLVPYKLYFEPYEKDGSMEIECNLGNEFCALVITKKVKFQECSKSKLDISYYINENKISQDDGVIYELIGIPFEKLGAEKTKLFVKKAELIKDEKKKIYRKITIPDKNKLDYQCIKNSILYPIYKEFLFARNLFYKFKETAVLATANPVNPLLNGETSISNIVKRYPQSYIFKPLLFLSSIIMVLYWLSYQKIFSIIEKKKRISKFAVFGILSSIFLFLHVLFLGLDLDIDNSIYRKIRRIIIISFIFSELSAQFFLARRIFIIKNILFNYTYRYLIYLKLTFVIVILLITVVAILILIFVDPGSTFNNILEWDYFIFLLIFYLLSALMWKRKLPVHTPEGM